MRHQLIKNILISESRYSLAQEEKWTIHIFYLKNAWIWYINWYLTINITAYLCLMMYFTFILGKWIQIHSTEKNYLHLHCNSYCEQRALTPVTKCMCLSSSPFVWTSLMSTDKRTDVWSQDFMIWRIDFGLWAVAWAGHWEKGSGPIMSNFWGPFFHFFGVKKLF